MLQIVRIKASNQEFTAEKTSNDVRYASTQSKIATMHASSTRSSTGPGKKLNGPTVCHKLMLGKTSLSGSEDYDLFDDWYANMSDDSELLIPGSKKIMM